MAVSFTNAPTTGVSGALSPILIGAIYGSDFIPATAGTLVASPSIYTANSFDPDANVLITAGPPTITSDVSINVLNIINAQTIPFAGCNADNRQRHGFG